MSSRHTPASIASRSGRLEVSICSASTAWFARALCESAEITTEMPTLLPMLRTRLNIAAPSLRSRGASEAKVTVVSGGNTKPMPSPCTTPVTAISRGVTSVSKAVIACSDTAHRPSPNRISRRGSTRSPSRPTAIIASAVPTPRGASSSPVSNTG